MVASAIALRDVHDVYGFAAATLRRTGLAVAPDERDDLVAEGVVLLYDLERSFEPHREGYAQAGSFAGFAARYLPKRMRDVWHQRHEEHSYATEDDGTRRWRYGEAAVSLDHLREDNSDGVDARTAHTGPPELEYGALERVLAARARQRVELALRACHLKSNGYTTEQIVDELELAPSEFRSLLEEVRRALEEIRQWQ